MKVDDLVKVNGPFVREYALIVEIGEDRGTQFVKVRFFNGEEASYHPTQIQVLNENRH